MKTDKRVEKEFKKISRRHVTKVDIRTMETFYDILEAHKNVFEVIQETASYHFERDSSGDFGALYRIRREIDNLMRMVYKWIQKNRK